MPNMDPLGFQVSDKKIFENLMLGCHGNQTISRNHILSAKTLSFIQRTVSPCDRPVWLRSKMTSDLRKIQFLVVFLVMNLFSQSVKKLIVDPTIQLSKVGLAGV